MQSDIAQQTVTTLCSHMRCLAGDNVCLVLAMPAKARLIHTLSMHFQDIWSRRYVLTWLCGVDCAGVPLPSNWRVETKTRSDGATDKVPSLPLVLSLQLALLS